MRVCILVVLALFAGCTKYHLVKAPNPKCDSPCFDGENNLAGKGVCAFGKWDCADDDQNPVCLGSGKPGPVVCNGLDNNCDGFIDEPVTQCVNPCGSGIKTCVGGVQSSCLGNEGGPEVCDGLDNDCDGIIDNIVYKTISDAVCYDAPLDTLGKGNCKAGIKSCVDGSSKCIGQVLPRPEMCNHIDDNCDGIVDNGTSLYPRDIVICIDNSGSMGNVINTIKGVTQQWTTKYAGRADLTWALEECPGPDTIDDYKVKLVQNFTTVSVFNQRMAYERSGDTGSEPTIDAIYMTADPVNHLHLNWRAGAKRTFIMFSDEYAQSYAPITHTIDEAATEASDANMKVFIFTEAGVALSYQAAATQTGGKILDIYMSAAAMENELDNMIDECQ